MTSDAPERMFVRSKPNGAMGRWHDATSLPETAAIASAGPNPMAEYILSTPAALSDHPTVKALVADAQAAVAMVVEKAAEVVKGLHEKLCTAGHPTLMLGQVTTQTLALEAAIRTLADTDGLARVEALRKERDAAALESQTAWALLRVANDNTEGVIAERDRLAADLAAAQAQIEALRGACEGARWRLKQYDYQAMQPQIIAIDAAIAALPAKEGSDGL